MGGFVDDVVDEASGLGKDVVGGVKDVADSAVDLHTDFYKGVMIDPIKSVAKGALGLLGGGGGYGGGGQGNTAFAGQSAPDIFVPEIMPFPSVANPVGSNIPLYAGSPFQPFINFGQGGFYNGLSPEMFANPFLASQVGSLANYYQNQGNFHAPALFS